MHVVVVIIIISFHSSLLSARFLIIDPVRIVGSYVFVCVCICVCVCVYACVCVFVCVSALEAIIN